MRERDARHVVDAHDAQPRLLLRGAVADERRAQRRPREGALAHGGLELRRRELRARALRLQRRRLLLRVVLVAEPALRVEFVKVMC